MKILILSLFLIISSISFSYERYNGSGYGSELQTRLELESKVREFKRKGYKILDSYYSGGGRVWSYYILYEKE